MEKKMFTIAVIYTHKKILDESLLHTARRYNFNVNAEVEVGQLIKSDDYHDNLQVVEVFPDMYSKVSRITSRPTADETAKVFPWVIKNMDLTNSDDEIKCKGNILPEPKPDIPEGESDLSTSHKDVGEGSKGYWIPPEEE